MSTDPDDLRRTAGRFPGLLAEASATVGPDEAARRAQYRRVYGVEPPDPQAIAEARARREAQDAASRSRRVEQWVSAEPERPAIARGGLNNLADTDEVMQAAPKREKSFVERAKSFAWQVVGGENEEGQNFLRDENWSGVFRSLAAGAADIPAGLYGAAQAASEILPRTGPLAGALAAADLASLGLAGTTTSGVAQGQRQAWQKVATDVAPTAKTEEGETLFSGVRSIPTTLFGLAAGIATGGAAPALTLMGGVAGGTSYGQARDQGLSPQRAGVYGAIDAGIEAGTEMLPIARLIPGMSGGSFLRRAGEAFAADIVGEQIATLGQDLNKFLMIEMPQGKTFDEFRAERGEAAFDTLVASIIGSGAATSVSGAVQLAARKVGGRLPDAEAAARNTDFLETLNRLASASEVLQRDPASFEEFVAQAGESAEISDVFVEAEQLQLVLNQSDLTVEQMFDMTGMTPEGLQAAVERGEDIALPIGQYAARIAPTPLSASLLPHLRLDPDQMSKAQAEAYFQEAQAEFEQEAEAQLAQGVADNGRAASRQRVEEGVIAQLASAGRFSEGHNRTYASLVGAFFDTMGARLGVSAEDLASRYGLQVQSGATAAPTYDQPKGELAGLPANSRGGFTPARDAARVYMAQRGEQYDPPRLYTPVVGERAARIAAEYEAMPHAPTDPVVREAYGALIEETMAQYEVIKATGLQIEFVQGEDPYAGNPWGAVDDVRENNHIWVFSTEQGYGQAGISEQERTENPMLATVPGEEWSGQPVLVNDVFRVVHDYFGHIKTGVGFRADGEENAWRAHASMFSPLARRALTTETRGQNSWLNYGPHGEANRTARVEDTVFAEQKIGLMPEWTAEEGRQDPAQTMLNQSAAPLQTLPLQVQGSGPGGRVRNWDVGEAFTLRHQLRYGRALDPTDPEDYKVALQSLLEDYANQQAQPDNGEAWYSDDIAEALAITTRILPELEDPVRRDIFLTAVALLSPQQGPLDNWNNAIVAMTGYSIEGRFAYRHPDGMEFGVKSHSTGLGLFEHLIRQYGEIGALVWLNDEHTGREMEEIRRSSGLFRNKAENYLPKEMNKTESKLGVYMFGPKVGDFMLNSTGMDQSAVTVDLWMARTYNRVIGRLTDVNAKQAEAGGLADAMRGRSERAIVKQLVRDAAEQVGIAPSAMQAALWYFEQRLYRKHGIQSESTSFSDAAREAAERRGISVDGVTAQGSAARSDEAESRDLGEGVRVYNQDGLNPLDAFKRESYFPSRAVRLEDGTVLADIPNWYPARQASVAEAIGATAVEAVKADDPRLDTGVPLWHARPPINPDGTMTLHHWGSEGISRTDPARWGESDSLPASERSAITSSLPRTYFGIASGQPGGYIIEFPSRQQYEARVPAEQIYDIDSDPAGLKPAGSVAELERKIKAAGYLGYWTASPQLGLVATVFESLDVAPAGPQVLFQDAVFFSALERAIEKTTTNKAPAQQWIATLRKAAGVKEEELEWTGLLDFLAEVEGPVTKEQMLEVVRAGGIRTDEVVLGERNPPEPMSADFEDLDAYAEALHAWEAGVEYKPGTQFESWTTDPQNETYRELLITLPVGEGGNPDRAPDTHWDISSVVAHARFMDKTDADGKKVLFVEEVQSDWHQKGRDQGYAQPSAIAERQRLADEAVAANTEAEAAEKEAQDILDGALIRQLEADASEFAQGLTPDEQVAMETIRARQAAAQLRAREARMAVANMRADGIPNAPFRASWPALVMKRMIRWAAEHGYERIAWTTGEQQAERYNLSQTVQILSAARESDDRLQVIVGNPAARTTLAQNGMGEDTGSTLLMSDEQAAQAFGKDVAAKLIESADAAGGEYGAPLAPEDLRVGGEGMKAFYDRNLVNITNGLVKKYGTKVGPVAIANPADMEEARRTLKSETAPESERVFAEQVLAGETQPGFDITPELADAAMGGFPLFQRERAPRGQIAFPADITAAPSVITLLRGADASTFVHELGHFFFETVNHMANQAGAPPAIVADRDAILRYLGVESASEWEQRTPAQRRDGHERMARSFEAYLYEGKTPSLELAGLFSRLRKWMMRVYRSLTQLDVELTDDVRGVFDRMLASEEQIREAQADAEMRPLAEKPEGMTPADWEEYQRLNADAFDEAAKNLEARSLRDMRYSRTAVGREIKRLQREVADQRADMRAEVEAELSSLPVYRAIKLLRTGMLDDQPWEGEHKLNTGLVREILQLQDAPLPEALRGMTKEDGWHPQQVAELFGFTSPHHLLMELSFASPLDMAVEDETDSRMRERYGEVNDEADVEEAARAAVHNEVRRRFVSTELAALQQANGKKRVLAEAARRIADGTIGRLRIRDLRPSQYEAAERRAAMAARKAGTTDLQEAIRQKRNQLLQFSLAKAAHDARDEVKAARDYLRKFDTKKMRETLDPDFLDQIDQLLEGVELRQVTNKAADRRKALADWMSQMQEQGFEPALDPEAMRDIARKPWRELTVEEMRELVTAVRSIAHTARLTKKLLTAKKNADIDQAAAEMSESVRNNAFTSRDEIIGAKTWWEKVVGGARDFFMMHRKMANLVHVFDGNNYGGVFWDYFIKPMNAAGDNEVRRTREANLRLAALFAPLLKENTTRREFEPAIGRSISMEDRLMVALNMGNEANLQRLMDGDRWDYEQVQAIIRPLTAQHWDFVESVWSEIDSFWPEIAAKERRVSGIEPEKVQPMPFQVELDGELRLIPGGYFPIKYDADRSSKASADEAAEVLKQMTRGLYTNSQTRRGHTKERVDTVKGRPLRKDFGVIFGHVNQVIHDLSWHEYLIDANRLLKHNAVDAAIRQHYGPEALRWMRKALEDIAIGDIPNQTSFESSIRHLRTGVSVAAMGWSFWTSLLQPTGLTQSMSRIGTRHVMRGIGDLFGSPKAMNEKLQWIYSVSSMMQDRGNTMQREISEVRNRIGAKSPLRKAVDRVVPQGVSSAVGDSFFFMIAKAQLIADVPTWLGQYHKAMENGADPDDAVAQADQAVLDSQGGGSIKDLAGIQRGGELQKLFTNFYSYFSATFNLMSDRRAEFRRVGMKDLPFFIADMALLTFVPATLASLMYQLLRTDEDEPEEFLKTVAIDNLSYMLGLMVGLREIGGTLAGVTGYQGPAGTRFFAEVARFGKQAGQGELDEALVRAGNSMAGILLHYPASQIDRTARGVIAIANGEAGPSAVLVGPPVER